MLTVNDLVKDYDAVMSSAATGAARSSCAAAVMASFD